MEIDSTIYVDDLNNIIDDLGLGERGEALAYSADTFYRYMDKYVPMSSKERYGDKVNPGDLRRIHSIYPESDYYVIEYQSPYAHAQYIGYTTGPVVNYTTPGTGPYWDERMITVDGDIAVNEIRDFIRSRF